MASLDNQSNMNSINLYLGSIHHLFWLNWCHIIMPEFEKVYLKAAETRLQSTYMDDSMDSVLTDESYEQLSELWSKAGMHTHKWLSNSPIVLSKIPLQDRVNKMNLDEESLPSVKTLGVTWIAAEDVFTFESQVSGHFLKKIAALFDPLEFLSPFTIREKC